MAVYERTYRPYEGSLTEAWSRFMIVPRYAYQRIFTSRLFLIYFVICFVPTAVAALWIYFHHNVSAFNVLQLDPAVVARALPIDSWFFWLYMSNTGAFAFLLALFLGPALISPDLANNGLALYLSRPFSRGEYVFGKFCVLAYLMSWVTWVPGVVLFFFQSYLEGWSWFAGNLNILAAILLSSWMWIVLLSLINMAASAWVRQKVIAGILVLAFWYVSAGFAAVANGMFNTDSAHLLDVNSLSTIISRSLFGLKPWSTVSPIAAWASMLVFFGLCLALLMRKIRAYQVVR